MFVFLSFNNEKGIFVVESKNYSGWIFGNENDKFWTQCLQNKTHNKFYNPIWQNKTHIEAIQTIFPQIQKDFFKSIIVFSERCELKQIKSNNKNTWIVKRENLKETIKQIIVTSKESIQKEEIENIKQMLNCYINTSAETKQKHINTITTNYK